MQQFNRNILLAALVTVLPALSAQAVTVQRNEVRMATDVCQPALPAYDGAFRKRPLAIQNEGTSNAFITCAFGGVFNGLPSAKTVTIGFTNITAAAQNVSCTLVDAHAGVMNPTYFPKTISVPPSGSPVTLLIWTGAENNNTAFTYPAASCNLPPGLGVQVTNQTYDEDVGQ